MHTKAMYKLMYGLFVLTASCDGKQNGCIINTGIQVTSAPNRLAIAVNKANFTHDLIVKNRKFNISIISEKATYELFKRFGFQSGYDIDKFNGFSGFKKALNEVNYITEGTNSYISAWVEQTVDLETHTLFIANVTNMEVLNDVPSATYEFYQNNIKPKLTANAENKGKNVWRCTVCGYEYKNDELSEDFVCPLCKHPASDFERVVS